MVRCVSSAIEALPPVRESFIARGQRLRTRPVRAHDASESRRGGGLISIIYFVRADTTSSPSRAAASFSPIAVALRYVLSVGAFVTATERLPAPPTNSHAHDRQTVVIVSFILSAELATELSRCGCISTGLQMRLNNYFAAAIVRAEVRRSLTTKHISVLSANAKECEMPEKNVILGAGSEPLLSLNPSWCTSCVLFEGTVYGSDFTATSATLEVTPTVPICGSLPPESTWPITVNNDYGLAGPSGGPCLVAGDASRNYYLVQIQPPNDVLFIGSLGGTLTAGDTTVSVTVTGGTPIYGSLPTSSSVTAKNVFGTSGNDGAACLVAEDTLGNYYLIPTASQCTLFWATLDGLLDYGMASASVSPTIGIYGVLPSSSVTALNTALLSSPDGGLVLVAATGGASPTYYILRVQPSVLYFAQLTSDLSPSTYTTNISPAEPIFGPVPSGTPAVDNQLGLQGSSGDLCVCVADESGRTICWPRWANMPISFWGKSTEPH